jgi:hypothetical protein
MFVLRRPTVAFALVALLAGCGKNLAVRVTPKAAKTDASSAAKVSSADMPVVVELSKDAGNAISAGSLRPYSEMDDAELETGKDAKLPSIAVGEKGEGGLERSSELFDAPYTDSISGEKFVFKNIYKFRGFFAMPKEEAIESVTSVKLVLYGLKKYLPAGEKAGVNSAQILCLVDVSQCNGEKTRTGALGKMTLVGAGEFAKIALPKQYAIFSEGSSLIGQEPGNDSFSENGKVEIELTEYFPDLKTVKGLLAASKVYADPDLRKMRFALADGVYFESGGLDVQFKVKADKVDENLGQVWNGPKAGAKDRSRRSASPESMRMKNGSAKKKADDQNADANKGDGTAGSGGTNGSGDKIKTAAELAAEKAAAEAAAKEKADAEAKAEAERMAAEKLAQEEAERKAAEEESKELGTSLGENEVQLLSSKPATLLPSGQAPTAASLTPIDLETALAAFKSSEAKTQIMLNFASNKPRDLNSPGMERASANMLTEFLSELKKQHGEQVKSIVVIGYTDRSRNRRLSAEAAEKDNQELSERRSLEVGRMVLAAGFPVRSAGAGEVSDEEAMCGSDKVCRLDRKVLIGIALKPEVQNKKEVRTKIKQLSNQIFKDLYVELDGEARPASGSSTAAASKPAASKPAASKPAASKPAASKPAASKPAASKPAASKPAASKPKRESKPKRPSRKK